MSPKKIKKLNDKKYRTETGLFIVEGEKNILELLASDFHIEAILGTKPFLNTIEPQIEEYEKKFGHTLLLNDADEATLVSNGSLVSNNAGIAVARQKEASGIDAIIAEAQENVVVVLEDVQNPGNLGTIIRLADWYGVSHIAASPSTTDFYNPKVIGATMGSFTRITVTYVPLSELLSQAMQLEIPVIVADLAGKNTHEGGLPKTGLLLMGSESHGVSDESLQFATDKVTIPRFGKAESLNVSVATGILLDTIRRGF
jgi:RNA methyltransferase, TrmH family